MEQGKNERKKEEETQEVRECVGDLVKYGNYRNRVSTAEQA